MNLSKIFGNILCVFFFASCSSTKFSSKSSAAKELKSEDVLAEELSGSESGGGEELVDGVVVDKFSGQRAGLIESAVDIVFVMDTSGSMSQEVGFLLENLVEFVGKLNAEAAIEPNVFLIMDNRPKLFGGFIGGVTISNGGDEEPEAIEIPDGVIHVEWNVSSTNALKKVEKFLQAGEDILDNEESDLDEFLPEDFSFSQSRSKEFIIITDDDSSYSPSGVGKFITILKSFSAKQLAFNGLVGLESSQESDDCSIAKNGKTYVKLSEDKNYGGLIEDICKSDWNALLGKFATKIISNHTVEDFTLSKTPASEDGIVVKKDGEKLAESDWEYEKETNSIKFPSDLSLLPEEEIIIIYKPNA